jgi:hypothetical protein
MKTKTIKLFQFDELPAEAKKKVIEKHYDINVDYEWWDDFVYEDLHTLAALLGVDVDLKKTYFSGFYHQGQGSAFTADIDVLKLVEGVKSEAWKQHAPNENLKFHKVTPNIERVCKLIKAGYIDFWASVRTSNRETSVSTDADFNITSSGLCGNPSNVEKACIELQDLIEDAAETINHWFFDNLRDNYDYNTSEEAIIESIKANEYWFDLSGNIGTPDPEPTIKQRVKSWFGSAVAFFTPKAFRIASLTFMWAQMLSVLIYTVIQHPVIRQFLPNK